PVSTKINRSPSSISNNLAAQVHILRSSAGLVRCHIDLGTTPNMAPPSSLKKPVSILYSLMPLKIKINHKSLIHSDIFFEKWAKTINIFDYQSFDLVYILQHSDLQLILLYFVS